MKQLYAVGIGPGEKKKMTAEAIEILESCDVIFGYTVYVELIREYFPGKEYRSTGMTGEKERCRMAFEAAEEGKKTAVICSGDAGVYGMAGLLFQIGRDYPDVEIFVAAGITAALSGAAVLGAPLGHDFAVISLSDLLTPWEKIEKRLSCCAMSDMAMAIYNPSSKNRSDYLKRACDLILQYQAPETVCGYVRNIGRQGEEACILTLRELREVQADMFTTVFVGNSETRKLNGRMITPRGYKEK